MTERTIPDTAAVDAAPWILGHQLQPHLMRRRGRRPDLRIQNGPWVFLGLRGLSPENRMPGFPMGEPAEMEWRTEYGFGVSAESGRAGRPGDPGPTGPRGPAGKAGRDGKADRSPAVSAPRGSSLDDSAALSREGREPAPIGMFIFQQPAGPGSGMIRPGRTLPPVGMLDGRTGSMASRPWVPASFPFEPGREFRLGPAAGVRDESELSIRPSAQKYPQPFESEHPPERMRSAVEGNRTGGGFAASLDSRPATESVEMPFSSLRNNRDPERFPVTPSVDFVGSGPESAQRPAHIGDPPLMVLRSALSLLPGIGGRIEPAEEHGVAMPEGRAELPVREVNPNMLLPMGNSGPGPYGFSFGRSGAERSRTPFRNRTFSQTANAETFASDYPQPMHSRGNPMAALVSALEEAVVRQVDQAMKKRKEPSPPPRPAPDQSLPAPDLDSDRTARRIADRIRKLQREERFRRGRIR